MSQEQRESVRRQFNRQSEAYARNEVVTDGGILDHVIRIALPDASDQVLDVACGPGYLTVALAGRVAHAVGIDVTEQLLDRARSEGRASGLRNLAFVRGDVEALPFADGSFELVTCKFAFHHFDDPERVFDEIARVTRTGGRILILDMIGSEDAEARFLHDRIEKWCDPSHAGALPRSRFERMFAVQGLEVRQALQGTSSLRLSAWLAHGGPDADTARRISEEAARLLGRDLGGIRFERCGEEIVLTHTGITYRVEKPSR